MDAQPGTVYFVGAGPGPAELLTVRAAAILRAATYVAHDTEVSAEVLALCADAERAGVGGETLAAQLELAATLKQRAQAGGVVVRLCDGDPMLFGRLSGLPDELRRAGVPVEIVPGIGPYTALLAYTSLRALHPRDASPSVALLKVDAEHVDLFPWERLAHATDAIVCSVDGAACSEVVRALITEGRSPSTEAGVVAHVGSPRQVVRRGTLRDIATRARALGPGPFTLLVGDAVAGRSPASWFEERPLFGKRVLVTRARHQAPTTARLLRARGAEAVVVPTIAIEPVDDALPAALGRLPGGYEWVAFTSANGVEHTFRHVRALGKDARLFGSVRLAAIGPGTAQALEPHGLRADVVAREFKGEGLAEEMLAAAGVAGAAAGAGPRVLLPRAREAREALPEMLRARGWTVDVVPAYETRSAGEPARAAIVPLLEARRLDAVLFTSASTVDTLADLLGDRAAELLEPVVLASIGPITSQALARRGLTPRVEPREYTLAALVAALETFYAATL